MKVSVYYKLLFAYSESNNKYFYTEFGEKLNIVYGKNTSGKSTLIESILYTFGINDEKNKLNEVLSEGVVFRLDIEIVDKESRSKVDMTIIRDDDVIFIRRGGDPVRKFIGIGGNRSVEHRELKKYWASLFEFDLFLESSGEYKQAPLEAFFLPFYVAQDVGWVYRHKSFRGLDFIKNFKNDFFDYYLGISNDFDRTTKNNLENRKREIETQIRFLIENKNNDVELSVSAIIDEKCVIQSNEYIEKYKEQKSDLIKLEKDYLIESNTLTYLEIRKNLLAKVRREIVAQSPLESKCPTCNQALVSSVDSIYSYYQGLNDTEKQISEIKELIQKQKEINGKINSIESKIIELRELISKNYELFRRYSVDDLSLGTWISHKVNVKLVENIYQKIGKLEDDLYSVDCDLKKFNTEEAVNELRNIKSSQFAVYFKSNLEKLGVKPFDDDRYTLIYKIPAFPKQGVELLKTLLAYTFSFCRIIDDTNYVHNLPLLLDAIFKEDIEEENKIEIISFIKNNFRHQMIISIADSAKNVISAVEYNERYLNGEAKMICIGKNERERSFLCSYNGENSEILKDTLKVIETEI